MKRFLYVEWNCSVIHWSLKFLIFLFTIFCRVFDHCVSIFICSFVCFSPWLQSSYWFDCLCEACRHNWPCFMKLPRDYFKLSGAHFKYKRCNRKALQKDVDKLKKRIRQTILDEKVPVTMLDEVPNHFEAARKMFHDWMNLLEELLMPASHQVINYD
mgnify:CR=1 FL=1